MTPIALPTAQQDMFARVAQAASSLGVPVYVVGGYVRDLLLGRPVGDDIDFVCVGDGVALAKAYARSYEGKAYQVQVFKNFGTAMVAARGVRAEFVGARRESYHPDSRKPDVLPGTLDEDLLRRDFTINAMAICLWAPDGPGGALIDPFNGQADLAARMIRTPAPAHVTFDDDPLRMLRAVRFAARLGFDLEADLMAAMRTCAPRLSIVSPERIADELNKLLMTADPGYGFRLALAGGILDQILPELVKLRGVEYQEGRGHKENFSHTLEVLQNVLSLNPEADLWLRWGALLHDIAKPQTKKFVKGTGWTFHNHEERGARMVPQIFRRLRLPLDAPMRKTQRLVRLHLRPIALVSEVVTDSAVRRLMADAEEDLTDLMTLARADITTKNPNKAKRYLANFDVVEEKMARVSDEDRLRNFQPVLTGTDIMEAYQLPPGPLIGKIKTQIREDILEGVIVNTLLECWARMTELGRAHGLEVVTEAPLRRELSSLAEGADKEAETASDAPITGGQSDDQVA